MKVWSFRFAWTAHKWTGIVLALVFTMTAVTGFLLLVKKEYAWIQPPTERGTEGSFDECITVARLFEVVLAQGHPDFATVDDIDRVDFRPDKRVFKVRSVENYGEIQVDATTGEVLNTGYRASDLIEQIHDGSFFGGWAHDYVMPIVTICLLFLVISGLWLWIEPMVRRRRRRRRALARTQS